VTEVNNYIRGRQAIDQILALHTYLRNTDPNLLPHAASMPARAS